jgi:hypothetical protein
MFFFMGWHFFCISGNDSVRPTNRAIFYTYLIFILVPDTGREMTRVCLGDDNMHLYLVRIFEAEAKVDFKEEMIF